MTYTILRRNIRIDKMKKISNCKTKIKIYNKSDAIFWNKTINSSKKSKALKKKLNKKI